MTTKAMTATVKMMTTFTAAAAADDDDDADVGDIKCGKGIDS